MFRRKYYLNLDAPEFGILVKSLIQLGLAEKREYVMNNDLFSNGSKNNTTKSSYFHNYCNQQYPHNQGLLLLKCPFGGQVSDLLCTILHSDLRQELEYSVGNG